MPLLRRDAAETVTHPQTKLGDPYVVRRLVHGVPLELLIATEQGRLWYDSPPSQASGRYDAGEVAFWNQLELVPPGAVAYDVGANNGVLSVYLASKVGAAGHVYAFDPVPQNIEIIRRNAELNRLTNVTPVHGVVGDSPGIVTFDLDTESAGGAAEPGHAVEVPELRLDAFDGPRPDFIKIDVEGYEGAVLRGAGELLESAPSLAIELHTRFAAERYGVSVEDILSPIDWERYEGWIFVPGPGARLEPFRPGSPALEAKPVVAWLFARRRQAAAASA